MQRMKVLGRLLKWFFIGFAVLLVLLGTLFGLLQTETGRHQLANRLGTLLSAGPDRQVAIEGIEGLVPFDMRFRRVTVKDRDGVWLNVDQALLHWSPLRLLKGRIFVDEAGAALVRLDRLPPAQEKTEKKPPAWPPDIPPFVVEDFRVDRFSLGTAVLGQAADFQVLGWMRSLAEEPGVSGWFDVARVDRAGTNAQIHWQLQGKKPSLHLDARLQEAKDSLLLRAAGYEDRSLVVQVEGDGLLADWQGRLSARAEGLGAVTLNVGLDVGRELGFRVDGEAEIATEVMPPSVSSLVADGKVRLAVAGRYNRARILAIERAGIDTGRVRLELSGETDLRKKQTSSRFSLELTDLAYLPSSIGLKGLFAVNGRISGPLAQPKIDLSFEAGDVEAADFRAVNLTGELGVVCLAPLDGSFPGLRVRGEGRLKGLVDREGKPLLPEPQVDWSLDVTVPDRTVLEIGEFAVAGQSFRVGFGGKAYPAAAGLDGELTVDLLDLHRFNPIWDQGRTAHLTAAVSGNGRSRAVTAQVQGKLDQPSAVPAAVHSMLGRQIPFSADLRLSEQGILQLSSLQVHLAESTLTGDAALDLKDRTIKGQGDLDFPLGSLSDAVSRPLRGALQIHTSLAGPWQSPEIQVRASGEELVLADQNLKRLRIALKSAGRTVGRAGTVALEAYRGDLFLKTNSRYELSDSQLRLSELEIHVPGAAARGELTWNLQTQAIDGRLQGEAADLGALPLDPALGGSMKFDARFEPKASGQEVHLEATAKDLAAHQTRIARLDLDAVVSDLLHRPQGWIEINAADLEKAGLEMGDLKARVEGRPSLVSVTGNARGRYGSPLEMTFKGQAALAQKDMTLTLNELQGRFDKYPYSLADSLVLHKRSDLLILEKVGLKVGSGRLSAAGEFGPSRLSFEGGFQAFPLEFLHLFGVADMTGSASGELQVSGRPDHPKIKMQLQVDEARIQGAAYEEVQPASLRAQAVLADNRLEANGVLKGLFERPVQVRLSCPVQFAVVPFAFHLPESGQLDGSLSAEVALGSVARMLHLDDQTIKGDASVDLKLGGRLGAPMVQGKLQVADGLYENYRTGTIVRELQVEATFAGHRLTITRAQGTDGAGGRIEATGYVELVPAEKFPLQIDLTFQQATLVRRDNYTVATDGQLQLAGDTRQLQLEGRLKLGPAEIRIPERLPAGVAQLEVVEINAPETAGTKQEPDKKEPGTNGNGGLLVKLDLRVDVPGRVYVQGRGLESEWQGELQISGTSTAPSVRGALSVVRGHLNFLGKRFDLASGKVSFNGSTPPSPDIDAVAEYQRSDLTARIHLTGSPENLKFAFESEPPLPEDEILARVLFNRSATKINPVQALKLAQALNALRGGGGGADLVGRARELAGLDQLEIETPEGQNSPSLSVGKYLTEDLYIELDKGFGSSEGDQVKVELDVLPNISVESNVGSDAQGGAGINWKYDY
jgi:translocation and assembly module TamB